MGEKNGKVAKMSKCVISSDAGDEDDQEVINPSPKKFRKRSNSSLGDFNFFPVFKTKNGYGSLSTLEVLSCNLLIRTALKSSEEEEEVVEEPKRRRSTRVRRPVIEPPKGYFSSVFFSTRRKL